MDVDVWTWTCGRGHVDVMCGRGCVAVDVWTWRVGVDVWSLELELGRGSRAWAEAKMWRKVGVSLGN